MCPLYFMIPFCYGMLLCCMSYLCCVCFVCFFLFSNENANGLCGARGKMRYTVCFVHSNKVNHANPQSLHFFAGDHRYQCACTMRWFNLQFSWWCVQNLTDNILTDRYGNISFCTEYFIKHYNCRSRSIKQGMQCNI